MGVTLDDSSFLQYLTKLDIKIGTEIEIIERIKFDKSVVVLINNKKRRGTQVNQEHDWPHHDWPQHDWPQHD